MCCTMGCELQDKHEIAKLVGYVHRYTITTVVLTRILNDRLIYWLCFCWKLPQPKIKSRACLSFFDLLYRDCKLRACATKIVSLYQMEPNFYIQFVTFYFYVEVSTLCRHFTAHGARVPSVLPSQLLPSDNIPAVTLALKYTNPAFMSTASYMRGTNDYFEIKSSS